MKTNSTKLTVAAGFAIAILGFILTFIGYANNTDNEITKEDTLVLAGFIAIVVGLVVGITALIPLFSKKTPVVYNTSERTRRLAYAALFAALAYIGFQFFRFDITVGSEKTAFHLGNTFVVLAALFLGGPFGGMAGAIGLTLADFTSGYATSAPKTFFLKLCIGLITGLVAHTFFHITKIHDSKKVLTYSAIASACALAFNIVADPLTGYFYKKYLFGLPQDIAKALAKLSSITTAVNAVLSVICAVLLYNALRPILIKSGLFVPVEKE